MAEIIRMPRMSDTMEEGVIVGWMKKEGDSVEPGDVLAEVETDKATMELESFQEGTLLYIGVKEGPVKVNGVLAIIGAPGEDFKALLAEAESQGEEESAPNAQEEVIEQKVETKIAEVAVSQNVASPTIVTPTASSKLIASPLARSMASKAGIQLEAVIGTGDNGRIVKKDIEAYLASGSNNQTTTPKSSTEKKDVMAIPAFSMNGSLPEDTSIPVSQMRKVIAKRLGESKFGAPHFYLTVEINMDKAKDARKSMNEISPVRISFNDFVVKACAFALRQHPTINSSWLGDTIRINGSINIGVAVAVDDGLLVPVIKHADKKSLSQIDAEVRELANKAKNKKLQPDQMQGNTFTVSNLGMFDIEEFTAIINPPDSCILAVGSIIEKPIVVDGEIKVGNMMKVTLSCDHRVVDGASGAKFLRTLKTVLEDPVRLLV